MSRYYVFTEEQLEEALDAWLKALPSRVMQQVQPTDIVEFLNSRTCIDMGMARDLPAPRAKDIHITQEHTS